MVDVLDTQFSSCYWSVFDRTGKVVVDQAEKNNLYLINKPIGIINGMSTLEIVAMNSLRAKKVKNPGIYTATTNDVAY